MEKRAWIPALGATYHLGVDGISVLLVLLTTLHHARSPSLGACTAVEKRPREFYALLLALETGMLGTFLALDLLLFYVFWEVMLIPMYLLIGIWGGPRRVYAAVKFFLYTMAGSVLMLVAILSLYFLQQAMTGVADLRRSTRSTRLPLAAGDAGLAVPGVRARLRDQGADVPVPHLAARRARRGADRGLGDPGGVLLKMGTYGFLRFAMPLFPNALGAVHAVDRGARGHRHHLRRAGRDGAARHEEAGRLLVGEPPRASACSGSSR